jgi:subtilase family serine protease
MGSGVLGPEGISSTKCHPIKERFMIRRLGVFSLALAAVVTIASIASQAASIPTMTRQTRGVVVNGEAKSLGEMPATQTMHFNVILALRHAPELENFLQELYDPSSANYRHFLTSEEFTARFGASQEDWDATVGFAKKSGFQIIGGSREGMTLQLKGTVAQVEKAFHVTMGLYHDPAENRTFFAPDREPSVDLPFALWHVSGLDNYSMPHPMYMRKELGEKPQVVKGSCPGGYYCGSDMRGAYYGTGSLTGAGQNIALLELAGTDLADLTTYYKNAGQTEPYTPTLVSTGGYGTSCFASNGCDDTEQTLDMTQAMGMAPGSTMTYMYVCGDAYGSGTFDETGCLSAMVSAKPLSLQISSSWAWKPADPATDDPYYEQMAAQGQSYFVAAGDDREWSSGNFPYPAEDAWAIGVGGTDLIVQSAGGPWASETGWSDSGGGISPDGIPIPSWQQLSGVINSSNRGSKSLRNGPDVAGEANFDFYVCADQTTCQHGYGGTSFAAPMWAGYIALANQQAAANGVAAVGFINPAIYPLGLGSGYAAAFHDITSGTNGFPAVTGYDLITGWGSPNGAGLINALVGTGGGGPAISFNPASLKWGKVPVHTTKGRKKVTVTNSGSATLNISSIAVTGDFALVPVTQTKKVTPCSNGLSLAAGASCVIRVSFTPTQVGARSGAVNFTDNAPGSPQSIGLTGTGK